MKMMVYSYRKFDEAVFFDRYSEQYGIDLKICQEAPDLENVHLAQGCDCLNIITTKMDAKLIEQFYDLGIKYIVTRTIGFDHIDVKRAKELGMRVSNVTYSPNSVADYALMLILMLNRKMKAITQRAAVQDFSLPGIIGRELADCTVGVIGTGRIGRTVIKNLSGFGCKIIAYDLAEDAEVKKSAEYVSLPELFETSDMITLHAPLNESNYHLINKETIAKMKAQVQIVNTARGGLIDTEALIAGIESGKIGGAALDVIEREFGLYYYDLKNEILDNRQLAVLKAFPNVIVTPHMAFYTEKAISDMVENSLKSYCLFKKGEMNPFEV